MSASSNTRPHLPDRLSLTGRLRDAARPENLRTSVPAALAVAVGAVVLIAYSVGQWRSMYVPSWDLAIFSELAKAYAHADAPIVPIKGEGYNLLGDHFHPILVLLAPVWWVAPTPLSLLILQDLLLAVSAWPITRLAARTVGPVAATALGLCYSLSWGFQGAVAAQFHEIAFAVPMLAWASVAFVERRWWDCALWCAPLVLVKEDLGLTVFMAGLAIAWRGRRSGDAAGDPASGTSSDADAAPSDLDDPSRSLRLVRRLSPRAAQASPFRLGLGLAVFGFLFFMITVLVLIPLMSSSGTWEYGIGGNAGDGSRPGEGGLLTFLGSEVQLQTLAVLALTAGLIGLASPWFWLIAPTIAWRFLSAKEFYWEWENWHYNATLIPVVIGAMLDVVTRATTAHQVIDMIPAGASVETDLGLLAYLVPDHTVYWVGTGSVAVDYVVVDAYSPAWNNNPPADAAAWASQRTGVPYTLVLSRDGYQVAKRSG